MTRNVDRQLRIPGAVWVHDNDVENCMNDKCLQKKPFSMFNRRHHCRWCGKIFCDVCAPVRECGARRCAICYWPMCFMPCRLPVFVKKNRSVGNGGAPSSPTAASGVGDENPFEIENRNLRGVAGYFVLGKFNGNAIDCIMSFLETSSLNALLQVCKKSQSHFHVRGLRYESQITDRFPTYMTQARIGDGGGGVVFKVRDPRNTEQFVALKVVKKSAQFGFAVWKRLRTEIDLQLKIDHPNIAKLLDVFQTPDEVTLVIEAGDGGSLRKVFEALRSSHQQISWFTAHCIYQSASALIRLRELNIAHRDIKCDNIVMSDDFSRVMMIDFGLAEFVSSDRQGFTPCGTVGFASPENIAAVAERRSKFYAGIDVMHKADIFSLGVVAYMMLSSTKPFKGSRFPEMHREVQAGLRCDGRGWGHVSSAAKMLVERMLRGDAGARASAEELMQDPWVLEGCKRFQEVIEKRRDDLSKAKAQLDSEWDMPAIQMKPGSPQGDNSCSDLDDGSCWIMEGQELAAQVRFVS